MSSHNKIASIMWHNSSEQFLKSLFSEMSYAIFSRLQLSINILLFIGSPLFSLTVALYLSYPI